MGRRSTVSEGWKQSPREVDEQAIRDDDIDLRARALKAVGELDRADLQAALLEQLKHDNNKLRFWAAWSTVLTGDRSLALNWLRQEIEANSTFCHEAMQVALPALDSPSVNKTLKVLADNKETLRQAIIGAGVSGDPTYIPWLIQQMEIPELASVAGEAFSHICGVDLAYQDMEGELPEGDLGGPIENPEDENVAMDPDEDLSHQSGLYCRIVSQCNHQWSDNHCARWLSSLQPGGPRI